ncbi:SDR family NAD(P)-dependent oxidoreductase [Halomonas sp. V046]|uniref:SDR family NAD(P)-dependent oxidoreductase n=1 Tax=Halomonas sp. V046 TaxID=3459611 RepID=UPI004044182A
MFTDKHVVITGGSSGLGLSLAERLVDDGAIVTLVARDTTRLEAAKARLLDGTPDARVHLAALDITDEAETARVLAALGEARGGIDALINSAGILREGYFEALETRDFREVMEINFFGLLNATRAALPFLKSSRGRLINIASVAGLTGVFGYTPYCSAKHALVGLSESLRYELSPQGVRVQLVCPGEFDSPMVDALEANRTPENRAQTLTIPKATVEAIARDTLAGLAKDDFLIVPGRRTRLAVFGMRHLPGLTRTMMDRVLAKAYRHQDPSGAAHSPQPATAPPASDKHPR